MPYRDPALVGEITGKAVAGGYAAVKLHEIDVPQVRAARSAGGEFDLVWLEEPVWPPEDFAALARLKREAGVAIAAGENVGTVREFETLLSADGVTFAQPSVTKIGGIAEARKVYALAEARGIAVAPHSPYFGPGLAATLHLAATLPYPVQIERVYMGT